MNLAACSAIWFTFSGLALAYRAAAAAAAPSTASLRSIAIGVLRFVSIVRGPNGPAPGTQATVRLHIVPWRAFTHPGVQMSGANVRHTSRNAGPTYHKGVPVFARTHHREVRVFAVGGLLALL